MERKDYSSNKEDKLYKSNLYENIIEISLEKICLNTGISGGSDQCC